MSKNEIVSLIETMNNYDELASKAKAKADAIRDALKEEMLRLDTEELNAGAYIPLHQHHQQPVRYHHLQAPVCRPLQGLHQSRQQPPFHSQLLKLRTSSAGRKCPWSRKDREIC